jgi:hypothetical protein
VNHLPASRYKDAVDLLNAYHAAKLAKAEAEATPENVVA